MGKFSIIISLLMCANVFATNVTISSLTEQLVGIYKVNDCKNFDSDSKYYSGFLEIVKSKSSLKMLEFHLFDQEISYNYKGGRWSHSLYLKKAVLEKNSSDTLILSENWAESKGSRSQIKLTSRGNLYLIDETINIFGDNHISKCRLYPLD